MVGAAGTDNIITDKLNVTGISTLQNDVLIGSGVTLSPDGDIFATGITTVGILTVTGRVKIGGDLDVAGDITYDEITGRNLNITGVSTLSSTLQVGTGVTISPDGDVFATGVTTSTTFVGNLTGNVTGNADSATTSTTVSLSDESTDTTCFPTFATSATGNQALQTGTNLTFNSNTGDLGATSATFEHTTVGSAVTSSESGINVVGVITATSFNDMNGVGINTANVRTGILDVAGIATFRSNSLVGSGVTLSPDGDGFFTGVVTATSYAGDGSALTGVGTANVRTGILDVAGIATFRSNTLVGSGITLSPDGNAFHTGVVTATSFVGDGTNLTGVANTGQILSETLNVSIGATIGIASFSSSGIVTTTDAVGIVTYYGDVSNAAHQRWYLGANGTDDYTFVGNGCTITRHDPTLFLARGNVYEFVNNMNAHGFRIQMAYQNTGGQLFPHGVTNNGATVGTIRFEVPLDAPNTLYYQCAAHSGMAGTMTIYPSL